MSRDLLVIDDVGTSRNHLMDTHQYGRFQIPADDGFPVRIERYKSIGSKNRNLNMESSESGACDHLSKSLDIDKLAARVKVHLKIKALQDELKRSENLFKEFSVADPIKNNFNSREVTQIPNKDLNRTKRNSEAVPFIIHGMENFKKVNDLCWQQNGDEVSTSLAVAIRAKRIYDSAACYGGEEQGIVNIYA
jgi:two-component system, cell cycle response regulator